MFGRKAQQQGNRIVDPGECMVRPGIIQRTWLGELAKSLAQLGQPYGSDRRPWAANLDSLYELDMVLDMSIRDGGAGIFLTSNAFVGDMSEPGDAHLTGSSGATGGGTGGEPATTPGLPPGFPEQPRDREELELYCEEFGMRAINWIIAALDAPNGALVAGEENDAVVARLALRSLSSLTVSYAFSSYEKDMVVDALCGADVRERLDRLALRILALPQLAWWSEEFDPEHYIFHSPAAWTGVTVSQPGEPLPPELLRQRGIGRLSMKDRQVTAQFRTVDKEFRDLARAFGTNWWPQSQISGKTPVSYRSTSPEWFVPSRAELQIGLGKLAREQVDAVEERYLDELARNNGAVCTGQFLGDDAGDRPLCALVKRELETGERRILTIHSGRDWTDLVSRFPMVLVCTGTSDEPETWGGNARGVWVTVDWERASQEYDGIYLSVLGALDASYVPLRVAIPGPRGIRECWTMMTGWVPGSVLWLNDPLGTWPEIPEWSFDDVQREYEEALARLGASKNDGE
ncbi:MAG: hypothetical protein QM705_15405 [Ancrocorticia sp.]